MPLMRTCRTPFVLLMTAAFAMMLLAMHFGWMNVDGWNYIALADNLRAGHGLCIRPGWGNVYWAVFPAGYPALLALFTTLIPINTIIASKCINALLLVACAVMASQLARIPLLLSAMLFLTQPWLEIASNSWSENLFIAALLLSFLALFRYLESGRIGWLYSYGAALLVLVSSRYIGGFYLTGYLVVIVLSRRGSGRLRPVMALMATMAAGAFFAGYLAYNIHMTGYPTGIRRTPASEPFAVLLEAFLLQALVSSALLLLSPLLLLVSKKDSAMSADPAWSGFTRRNARCLMIAGGWYLLLLFMLRMHSHFELFGNRMVLPGLVLIALGVLGRAYALLEHKPALNHARNYIVFMVLAVANMALLYKPMLADSARMQQEGLGKSMARYAMLYGSLPEGTALIVPAYLLSGWQIDSPAFTSDRIFVVQIQDYQFKLDGYREFLHELRYHGGAPKYIFDFNEFAAIEELEKELAERGADPALAQWIKAHFAPNQFVECYDCRTH